MILPVSSVHSAPWDRAQLHAHAVQTTSLPCMSPLTRTPWIRSSANGRNVGGKDVRLQIIDSPYRLLIEPMMDYIATITAQRQPNEIITVVVPQFVPRHGWQNFTRKPPGFCARPSFLSQAS